MPARQDPDGPRDDWGDLYSERRTLGLEDVTNGYQIFFSARDWFAMFGNLDDWYGDPLDGYDGEWHWGELPHYDEPPDGGGASASVGAGHDVTIYPPPGEHEGNEDRYELGCARCDYLGSADTFADAEVIARLHEAFEAVLVDRWDIDR